MMMNTFFKELLNSSRAQALVSFDKQKRIPRSEPKAKKNAPLSPLFFFPSPLFLASLGLDDNTPRQINHARESDRLVRIVVHSKERRDGTRLFFIRNRGMFGKTETTENARVRAFALYFVFRLRHEFETEGRVHGQRGVVRVARDFAKTNRESSERTNDR